MQDLFDKWFDQHHDDQGLMVALNLSPDLDTVPRDLAQSWFNRRARVIRKKLNFQNGELTIYRCMKVDAQWVESLIKGEITRVGDHWTLDRDLSQFLKGGFGGKTSRENIILEAQVKETDFDVLSLFQPSYADEYEEMEILPTTVIITKIYSGDFSKVLAELNLKMDCFNSL